MNSSVQFSEDVWNDVDIDINDAVLQQMLDDPLEFEKKSNGNDEFNAKAGETWIYPNNLPLRAYQLNIVQNALFQNTLAVLPTGLGKTFIAAVVMYNIYRWFPNGKILFLAPTRPLVAQQIEACHKIMPFPQEDTIELTGKTPRNRRVEYWKSKRVFFATPQVVQSDMTEDSVNTFPFDKVKLIVFDEAHKARGRYAYSIVVQQQFSKNKMFRVLALTATPGRTMEDVAEVVQNLLISHLEVRGDDSPDVLPYLQKRSMKTIVVHLSEEMKRIRDELLQIIDPYIRQLIEAEVLSGSISKINRNYLIYEQKQFRENCLHNRHPNQAAVNSNFAVCITLYHALELLERHGLRVFVNYFETDEEGRNNFVLTSNYQLKKMIEQLRRNLGPNPLDYSTTMMTNGQIAEIPKDLNFGHPKFEEARKCLLEHFQNNSKGRAIIFCEYRESVTLMHRLLLQHRPVLNPLCFVGQGGGNTGSLKSLTQKQQIQVMNDFRSGICNILIATSVGEEGIDVGEVDLVICFDISTTNPTRFIQRIGRTGRQKKGSVIMLVTEGREQQLLKDVLSQKDTNVKMLGHSFIIKNALYTEAPRLIPENCSPKCLQTHVTICAETAKAKSPARSSLNKKPKVKGKTDKGTQDLRSFFKKVPNLQASQPPADIQKEDEVNTSKLQESFNQINEFIRSLASPPKHFHTQEAQKEVKNKKIRRLNKLIQRTGLLVPESEVILDIKTQIKSKFISKSGKLLALKRNPHFVKEIYDNYQILNALNECNVKEIGSEERDLRKIFKSVESLFGGIENIEKYLKETKEEQDNKAKLEESKCLDLETNVDIKKYQAKISKLMNEFECQGILFDNYDLLDSKLRSYANFLNDVESSDHLYSRCFQSADDDSHFESDNCTASLDPVYLLDSKLNSPFKDTTLECSDNEKNLSKKKILELLAESSDENETSNTPNALLPETEATMLNSLDYDVNMNDFLEPFPEEEQALCSQKENLNLNMNVKNIESPKFHPTKSPKSQSKVQRSNSVETSPSVFDMYVNKVRQRNLKIQGRSLFEKEACINSSISEKCSKDESIVVRPSGGNAINKRKILDSDSDSETTRSLMKAEDSMDVIRSESESPKAFPRKFKRPKLISNSFIEDEAEAGSDASADELEYTIGCYLKDSVIVSSGEEDDASRSYMQAVYLKSLRSPVGSNGGFKIPPARSYDDESQIFSQVENLDDDIDYIQDTFVAKDSDCESVSADQSLCPLEQAEKILALRRKNKRKNLQKVGAGQKRKRRRVLLHSSSSEEDSF